MKQTYSSILTIVVCVVFSKAVLPALQIPKGFWSDLLDWLVSPALSFLTVQMSGKVMSALDLYQRLSKFLKKLWETWVAHRVLAFFTSFLSDVSKSVGLGSPDSAFSSGTELQRSLKEFQAWISSLSPDSGLFRLISQLKTQIDHELDQGLSRGG